MITNLPFYLIFNALLLMLGVIGLRFLSQKAPLSPWFWPALLCKCAAGLAYGSLYVFYYENGGDTINFFLDGTRFAQLARQSPATFLRVVFWQEYYPLEPFAVFNLWYQARTLFFVKLVSFFCLLTNDHYWLISLYFSVFSFWGMWLLANTLARLYPSLANAAALSLLFWPSLVFFSAGLSKESLAMGAWAWLLARMQGYLLPFPKGWLYHLASLGLLVGLSILLLELKIYYLAGLAGAVAVYVLGMNFQMVRRAHLSHLFLRGGLIVGLGLLLLGLAMRYQYLPPPARLMEALVHSHNKMYIKSKPDDLIHYSVAGGAGYITLSTKVSNLLLNSPTALFSTLYRPFVWEHGGSRLKQVLGIENLLLLGLSGMALFRLFLGQNTALRQAGPLLWAACCYIVVLGVLMGLSTPNFGTLARYRIGILPVFVFLVLAQVWPLFKRKAPSYE
ncbi:MAG: hypothetical protein OHK0053_01760 [Microscillaceae bacterium]